MTYLARVAALSAAVFVASCGTTIVVGHAVYCYGNRKSDNQRKKAI